MKSTFCSALNHVVVVTIEDKALFPQISDFSPHFNALEYNYLIDSTMVTPLLVLLSWEVTTKWFSFFCREERRLVQLMYVFRKKFMPPNLMLQHGYSDLDEYVVIHRLSVFVSFSRCSIRFSFFRSDEFLLTAQHSEVTTL